MMVAMVVVPRCRRCLITHMILRLLNQGKIAFIVGCGDGLRRLQQVCTCGQGGWMVCYQVASLRHGKATSQSCLSLHWHAHLKTLLEGQSDVVSCQ